jgi:outer membrane protein TolC
MCTELKTWATRKRLLPDIGVLLSLWVLACAPPTLAEALTFEDALATAVREAPMLRATAARIAAAHHAILPASELPDPSLILGLDNVPVEGSDRFSTGADFMTMQRIGLMQEFTSTAKRRARADMASAQEALMQSDERETRQTVLRETALAWIARDTWEQQLAQVMEWQRDNELFDRVVRARLAAATGPMSDTLLPQEEAATIATLHDQVSAGAEQARAQLRRWVGDAADQPLGGGVPHWSIDTTDLTHKLHQHPELLSYNSRARVLDAGIAESRAATRPDWDVTVAWLERGSGFSDMAMLEVRVDLPLFTGSRQTPMVASKLADRAALDAERDASLREHAATLEVELSEYHRLLRLEQRYTDTLLPLADKKVDLAMASWRSAQGSLTEVIAARRERTATRLQAITTTGQRQLIAARLHFAYGDIDIDQANSTSPTGAQR